MPMQPLPQQTNPNQATQTMMQQSKAPAQASPEAVTQDQQSLHDNNDFGGNQDDFSTEILGNLEEHLNQLDPRQKQFLAGSLQHYANIVIPVLGIVCGQEVMDYFLNVYKQNFAKGLNTPQQSDPMQAQNSAPSLQGQAPNTGGQPVPPQAPAQPPVQSQPQQ